MTVSLETIPLPNVDTLNASTSTRSILRRFVRFGAVGAGGVAIQTLTLAVLLRVGGIHYIPATALAVEASVLNNFLWHRKWTWADRPKSCVGWALLRFNATNGVVSLIGNLIIMIALVSWLNFKPMIANLLTIAICSLANFALADRVVFT